MIITLCRGSVCVLRFLLIGPGLSCRRMFCCVIWWNVIVGRSLLYFRRRHWDGVMRLRLLILITICNRRRFLTWMRLVIVLICCVLTRLKVLSVPCLRLLTLIACWYRCYHLCLRWKMFVVRCLTLRVVLNDLSGRV